MIPRQLAFLGLAALLLAGAGVAAAVTHDDDDSEETAAVTTTTTSFPDTTTSLAPATTTTPPPTTDAGSTSTTARGATTTTGRATTTTRGAASTTTTAAIADCTAAQIEVTATTDKPSYAVGQQVVVNSTLRNRSSTACLYSGHTFTVTILSPAGATIIGFDVVTPPGPAKSRFVPGATLTGSVPWDQRTCQAQPCPQPPPGPYSAVARWTFAGGPYEARAAFTLTG